MAIHDLLKKQPDRHSRQQGDNFFDTPQWFAVSPACEVLRQATISIIIANLKTK